MRIRLSTLLLLFALGCAGAVHVGCTSQAHKGPNIVVVLLDDVRADDLQTLLDAGLMPNLQQFVVGVGMRFDNSFVTTSLCGPSRATFLTGQYMHNHSVDCDEDPTKSKAVQMLNHDSTLPVWLRNAGYRTAHVGKYLNGYGSGTKLAPGLHNPQWIPPGWDDWFGLVDPSTYQMYGFTANANRRLIDFPETPENYQTDVLARMAVRAIENAESAAGDRPLFLVITPLASHSERGPSAPQRPGCTQDRLRLTIRPAPRHIGTLPSYIRLAEGPAFNEQDMSDKPPHLQILPLLTPGDTYCMRTNYRARLESLLAVDDLIGRVVESLVRNGKWNDTVLMVTSDNGFLLGEHRMSSKVLAYEPSIRVPLFIRIPGAAAGRTAALVVNNDLAATVVDLAGAQPDIALDGRSLLPLYTDPQPAGWRKRVLVEYLDFVGRPDSSILQQFFALRTAPTDPYAPNALAVFWNNGSQELYALDQDPAQLTNLASDPQAQQTLAYLKDWVDRLRYCAGLTCQSLENGNAGVSALFRSATNTN